VALGGAAAAGGAKNANMHWVATWATAPATFLTYVPRMRPRHPAPGARRQIDRELERAEVQLERSRLMKRLWAAL
jgi:hypothetical protein